MHYLRQLTAGKADDWVHDLFTRYGRGRFDGPVCEADVGKDVKFKASVEFATLLCGLTASGGGDFKADGAVYGKRDFRGLLDGTGVEYDDKSKPKKGVFAVQVAGELPGAVVSDLCRKAPYAMALIGLSGAKGKLKCKRKPPKPGGEKDADFVAGSMDSSQLPELSEEVFSGASGFKKAKVEYVYVIEELLIPAGMGPEQARVSARRKGKILRTTTVDGSARTDEFPLEA
jgi:hypothetical protein